MKEALHIIQQRASQLLPEIISIRRHLHQHPELSFEEHKTAEYVASVLRSYGIPFQEGIVGTGLVAEIKGAKPGKTIALRADLDALPILEKNPNSYCSQNNGVMHACGHDVHTASLLGAAKILHELKEQLSGSVKLIFQPGEEKLPGGASLMIKAGVLENPKPARIFAQHVYPSMETGKVGFRKGMYMASTDELYVTVKGKGGHAAMPADYNNPIFIAGEVLRRLDIEFKTNSPAPTVLAFGRFIADGATNVIPQEVKIEGTFRTMDEHWRAEAHRKMIALAEKTAIELGGKCEFEVRKGYPFLVNDEAVTQRAIMSAEEYLGKENVEELPLRMTAEDFAFYSHQVPACFYRLGTGNARKGITAGVHTATFDIDENALATGMGLMAWIAFKEMKEGK
ncbi:MAG TPA: M20 family metallopeptidase [Bacteroidia bacterium]|nr:M20 family metallopeptidase [Bacteroidia bacterium]